MKKFIIVAILIFTVSNMSANTREIYPNEGCKTLLANTILTSIFIFYVPISVSILTTSVVEAKHRKCKWAID